MKLRISLKEFPPIIFSFQDFFSVIEKQAEGIFVSIARTDLSL